MHTNFYCSTYEESLKCIKNLLKDCDENDMDLKDVYSTINALKGGLGKLCENDKTYSSKYNVTTILSLHPRTGRRKYVVLQAFCQCVCVCVCVSVRALKVTVLHGS